MILRGTEEVVQCLLEALRVGNIFGIRAAFSDDAILTINLPLDKPYGGVFNGRKEIIKGFKQRSMQFVVDGSAYKVEHFIVEGTRAAVEWSLVDPAKYKTAYSNYSAVFEVLQGEIRKASIYVET